MQQKGIAVAGSIIVDKIYSIDAYPNAGELTKIRSAALAVGGLVPNDGIDIKKIDPSIPVYAIGKIGNDDEGKFVKSVLEQNGLDTDGVVVSDADKTSFTDVMSVIGGQRTFFTYPGSGATFGKEDIDWDRLPCKMLHLGYFLLLDKVDNGDGLEILKEAKRRGIKTSIDLVSENSDRYSLVRPCLPYVDNLIVNEIEGARLCGMEPDVNNLPAIAKALKECGVGERVILHTKYTGICYDGKHLTELPSFDVPKGYIQGTTGAGDAYCSGALVGIYQGKSDADILQMATVAATCSLGTADATSGLKTYEEMEKICEKLKKEAARQ